MIDSIEEKEKVYRKKHSAYAKWLFDESTFQFTLAGELRKKFKISDGSDFMDESGVILHNEATNFLREFMYEDLPDGFFISSVDTFRYIGNELEPRIYNTTCAVPLKYCNTDIQIIMILACSSLESIKSNWDLADKRLIGKYNGCEFEGFPIDDYFIFRNYTFEKGINSK